MTDKHDTPSVQNLKLEPEDLDGHTLEELTDYLAAGRTPPNASIDASPGCQIVLDALERLHALTPQLLVEDAQAKPVDEGWVQKILAGIALDARAGRRIPIPTPLPRADLGITEGAVRGLIRGAERAVPGAVVGRCRLEGEVTQEGAPIHILIDASVAYGEPIPDVAQRLRAEIAERLSAHTRLNITEIDITVYDIQKLPTPVEDDGEDK